MHRMRSFSYPRGFAGLAILLFAVVPARNAYAQVSPYFVTGGTSNTIFVIQNGVVTASIPTVSVYSGSTYEYPIAVFGSTFRTTNGVFGAGTGSEYTLSGTPTGATYTLPSPIGEAYDATTDGL